MVISAFFWRTSLLPQVSSSSKRKSSSIYSHSDGLILHRGSELVLLFQTKHSNSFNNLFRFWNLAFSIAIRLPVSMQHFPSSVKFLYLIVFINLQFMARISGISSCCQPYILVSWFGFLVNDWNDRLSNVTRGRTQSVVTCQV